MEKIEEKEEEAEKKLKEKKQNRTFSLSSPIVSEEHIQTVIVLPVRVFTKTRYSLRNRKKEL